MTFMEMLKIKNLTHDFVDEEEGTKLRAVDNVSLDGRSMAIREYS